MEFDPDNATSGGLQFFGTISASISHEIKNILAVLNENAGLLEDLVLMSEKGIPLNSERIKSVSGTIKNQIKRADLITKNMNSFAHSVDEAVKRVDIYEILELIVALTRRFADMREVKLELESCSNHAVATTNPFFLENLIYCCIDYAMKSKAEDSIIRISIQKEETDILIILGKLQGLSNTDHTEFPSEREAGLANLLKADINLDRNAGNIKIRIPENIG